MHGYIEIEPATPIPPTPQGLAILAAVLFAAAAIALLFAGCARVPVVRGESPPAWTNAAPWQGAEGPAW